MSSALQNRIRRLRFAHLRRDEPFLLTNKEWFALQIVLYFLLYVWYALHG